MFIIISGFVKKVIRESKFINEFLGKVYFFLRERYREEMVFFVGD